MVLLFTVAWNSVTLAQPDSREAPEATASNPKQAEHDSTTNFLRVIMLETVSEAQLVEIIYRFVRRGVGTWVKDQVRIRVAGGDVFPIEF